VTAEEAVVAYSKEGLSKTMWNLSLHSGCSGQDSTQLRPECKTSAFLQELTWCGTGSGRVVTESHREPVHARWNGFCTEYLHLLFFKTQREL